MRVVITGGSGFIGTSLAVLLKEKGHGVKIIDVLPPRAEAEFARADLASGLPPALLEGADAVIHLAGRNIFGRWNGRTKRDIEESRVRSTGNLVAAIGKLSKKPEVLVSASAVGYYGDRGDEELTEEAAPGTGFLAKVCLGWEAEARKAEAFGVRTVQIRTAPVLGHGGFLAKMLPAYRLGLGGPLSDGRHWMPWIHMADICGIYAFAVGNRNARGPLNSCAPEQVRNREFSGTLARVLKRPAVLPVPRFGLRLLFGGLGDEMLASQKVSPAKLLGLGYAFAFPRLEEALRDVVSRKMPRRLS